MKTSCHFEIYIKLSIKTFCNSRFQCEFQFQTLMEQQILNYPTTCVCYVTLWMNASTTCLKKKTAYFSCLTDEASLYTSPSAKPAPHWKNQQVGLCRDHSSSACKLQILFLAEKMRYWVILCAVWRATPSCWSYRNLHWFVVYIVGLGPLWLVQCVSSILRSSW